MENEPKRFSQMKKNDLYEVVKTFKKGILSASNDVARAKNLVHAANELLNGLEDKIDTINSAEKISAKIQQDLAACEVNIKKIETFQQDGFQMYENLRKTADNLEPVVDEIRVVSGQTTISAAAVKDITKKASEMNNRIEKQKKKSDDYLKAQLAEFAELKSKVERLVPQAALGSLVSSFYEAKLKYGDDNNDETDWLSRNFLINSALYFIFILSLLAVVAIFLLPFISFNPFTFNSPTDMAISIESTISRFLLVMPLLWIALHMSNKIGQRAALYEEYNYKQRLTTTYMGFIKEYKDETTNSKFTRELLKHINKPPSITKKKVYSESPMDVLAKHIRERRNVKSDKATQPTTQTTLPKSTPDQT